VDIVALHITVPRINVRKKPLRKRFERHQHPTQLPLVV
jgi:hypothetical protein